MDLTTIVPPPGRPQFNGRPEDWGTVERTLGMELPDDYKSLVNVYGTGSFFEFLYPLTPFAPLDTALNILSRDTFRLLSAYEEGRKEYPQFSPPFRAYPHKPGLFPWATTINGNTLFWLKDGAPNQWTVVVCDSKFSERHDHFMLCATDFLAQLALGKIESNVFPDDVLTFGARFTPYTAKK